MKHIIATVLLLVVFLQCRCIAQPADTLGIRLENYTYPYPVLFYTTTVGRQPVEIAYMDVKPQSANGKTVLLFHGKNFPAAYWAGTIDALTAAGYRVIARDALGFGKSSKPVVQYSFSLLAALDKELVDMLHIDKVYVVGHSMGGMVAARFALTYPETVNALVLEDAIGLEDWRSKGVPYRKVDVWYEDEQKATHESIKSYHKNTYYPNWKDTYEEWVNVQYGLTQSRNFDRLAWVNALTYDMIYNQPVVHEFGGIKVPALVVVGTEDHTKLARGASKEVMDKLGHYEQLGRETAQAIPGAELIVYKGHGHVPHLEIPAQYHKDLLQYLSKH